MRENDINSYLNQNDKFLDNLTLQPSFGSNSGLFFNYKFKPKFSLETNVNYLAFNLRLKYNDEIDEMVVFNHFFKCYYLAFTEYVNFYLKIKNLNYIFSPGISYIVPLRIKAYGESTFGDFIDVYYHKSVTTNPNLFLNLRNGISKDFNNFSLVSFINISYGPHVFLQDYYDFHFFGYNYLKLYLFQYSVGVSVMTNREVKNK